MLTACTTFALLIRHNHVDFASWNYIKLCYVMLVQRQYTHDTEVPPSQKKIMEFASISSVHLSIARSISRLPDSRTPGLPDPGSLDSYASAKINRLTKSLASQFLWCDVIVDCFQHCNRNPCSLSITRQHHALYYQSTDCPMLYINHRGSKWNFFGNGNWTTGPSVRPNWPPRNGLKTF